MKSKTNKSSRRLFLKKTALSLASLGLIPEKIIGAPMFIPNLISSNSLINGVQLGVITYSFREMPDQSAEAILEYILSCGVNAIELMGDPAEIYAGPWGDPLRAVCTFVIPILLVVNVPAGTLARPLSGEAWGMVVLTFAAAGISIGLSRIVFQAALARYRSASS